MALPCIESPDVENGTSMGGKPLEVLPYSITGGFEGTARKGALLPSARSPVLSRSSPERSVSTLHISIGSIVI